MNFTGQVCCEKGSGRQMDGKIYVVKWHEPGARWETQATGTEDQTRAVGWAVPAGRDPMDMGPGLSQATEGKPTSPSGI